MKKLILSLFILLTITINAQKPKGNKVINGKVTAITDGDTFKLLTKDSILIRVRLANVDCPERKQPFSTKAKQFVSEAIFGDTINIDVLKKDRYGRFIANVIYADSLSLSEELVKNGLAWHYVKYSNDDTLQAKEDIAKENKIGLWQDPTSIAPWEWRANKKEASRLKKLNKKKD
ncbi:Endonuclease YncB, thermonuclease family [Algibacter lectus]|uniref:thermonuclease family protein n=1 Tax=Algibacter lectus TaxID=221126 RepID=UPI0008E4EE18|nr:thermonuclease family protein [Algibacter lectus]SFB97763.1 Endonuclease YncB, thermonuclease family [Algibacter lectus]